MKDTGWRSSSGDGSRKYERRRSARTDGASSGDTAESCVKSRLMMMLRVVNSLGPFFSSSNNIFNKAGKSSPSIRVRCAKAADVVQRAFRQSNASCRRVSS